MVHALFVLNANRSGDGALLAASETGDEAVAEELIKAGAEVNKRNG